MSVCLGRNQAGTWVSVERWEGTGLNKGYVQSYAAPRDPRLRLILVHLKHATSRLDLRPDASTSDERAREHRIRGVDRDGIV